MLSSATFASVNEADRGTTARGTAAQGPMAGADAARAAGGAAAEVALDRARAWSGRSIDEPGPVCFT